MSEFDYPSNSMKSREERKTATKEVKKVVKGKVKTKKKNGVSKFTDVFISEDAANVKSYIFMDVLVPAVKEALSNIVTDGINMILFGDSGRSKKRTVGDKISYRSYYDDKDKHRESTKSRSGIDYDDIVLDTRKEAEKVLDHLDAIIDDYRIASVADLYDLVGESCPRSYNKYGWTSIGSAEVVRVRDGYWIKMPKARPID